LHTPAATTPREYRSVHPNMYSLVGVSPPNTASHPVPAYVSRQLDRCSTFPEEASRRRDAFMCSRCKPGIAEAGNSIYGRVRLIAVPWLVTAPASLTNLQKQVWSGAGQVQQNACNIISR